MIYPTTLRFAGTSSMTIELELRNLLYSIYNDSLAEMQADSGDRLLGNAVLPF